RLPAPGRPGDDPDADGESDEARLREGKDEPDPGDDDRSRGSDHDPSRRPVHDQHEARQDRDNEEASVDRGIPEDRVDAVEVCIRITDQYLRIPEDVAGLVLV